MPVWELAALVFRLVIFKSYVSALVAALHWKVTWPAVFTSWQGALLAGAVRGTCPELRSPQEVVVLGCLHLHPRSRMKKELLTSLK